MTPTGVETTALCVDTSQPSGTAKFLKDNFRELMSLAPGPEKAVCTLLRDWLISDFALNYMAKLNAAVKQESVANDLKGRDHFCTWIDGDVMETFDALQEAEVFENPRTISGLWDILATLRSSLLTIEENEIDESICYLFDVPYQLKEMIQEASEIPSFQKQLVKYHGRGQTRQLSVQFTDKTITVNYRIEKIE